MKNWWSFDQKMSRFILEEPNQFDLKQLSGSPRFSFAEYQELLNLKYLMVLFDFQKVCSYLEAIQLYSLLHHDNPNPEHEPLLQEWT